MRTVLVLLTVLAATDLQGTNGSVSELLAAGDYRAAWSLASAEADAVTRHRHRAEILYRAGDPAAALEEARAGLASAPGDLELLFYLSAAASWLGNGAEAERAAEHLRAAIASSDLAAADRASWDDLAERHVARARVALEREMALADALARARALALASLGATVAAASWVVTRGARPRPTGGV